MARLWQSGFEINSTTTNMDWSIYQAAVSTFVTSPVRTGTYALRVTGFASGTRSGPRQLFKNSAANGPFFVRTYFQYATLPSAGNTVFCFYNGSTTFRLGMELQADGTMLLTDEDGTIGSASAALSANTWYMLELKVDRTGAGGAHVVEGRINGVVFASSSTRNLAAGVDHIVVGANLRAESQTTGDWFFDDVALNDNTGSFQYTYPGEGKILHLKPNAAGDVNTFPTVVGGTAGAANNYTRVDELVPNGATDYNASVTANEEDLFNFEASGIGADDLVNVVAVGTRHANITAADAVTAFKLELMKTTGGTKSQSADIIPNSTTFVSYIGANPRLYQLTLYQDPDNAPWTQATLDTLQAGYIESATGTNVVAISTIWVSVDYTPRAIKTFKGLATASVKTAKGLAITSVKTKKGLA